MSQNSDWTIWPTDQLFRKIFKRLIPFLFLGYVVSFLDRTNVGLAALTMNKDIGLTATMFGWGTGLFFVGYVFFELPSNLIMYRVGARLWISRIMVTWGIVSACAALVQGPSGFYLVRFLLGFAEAGFNPGILLYLGLWIPEQYRSKAYAFFLLGAPVSSIISSPIYAGTLYMNGVAGLAGWQWLFIIEGLPAVILGILIYFALPARPAEAKWLSAPEKSRLQQALDVESAAKASTTNYSLRETFTDKRIILLSLVNVCFLSGFYGVFFWLPQVIKGFGLSNMQVGLVNAVPFILGAIAMIVVAHHSDRVGDRYWHTIFSSCVAAAGLSASLLAPTPALALTALCIGAMGVFAFLGVYLVLASAFLDGKGFAGGIAIIAATGNLGGFAGSYLIGWMRDFSGSFAPAIMLAAIALLLPAVILLSFRSAMAPKRLNPIPAPS